MVTSKANAMTFPWTAVFVLTTMMVCGNGQIVAYTLTYTSTDCSGTAGGFQARNQSTCTPAACARFGGGSTQGFCHTGTLASLANPVACPGCAYCGYVAYLNGVNCDPNQWTSSSVERLGVCVNGGPSSLIGYGCGQSGILANVTQYSDVACTIPVVFVPPAFSTCVAGQPVCPTPQFPAQEGICSYSNLFNGGGGQNGTHGTASKSPGALLFLVAVLIWATL
jgi:hypothetical protein